MARNRSNKDKQRLRKELLELDYFADSVAIDELEF